MPESKETRGAVSGHWTYSVEVSGKSLTRKPCIALGSKNKGIKTDDADVCKQKPSGGLDTEHFFS